MFQGDGAAAQQCGGGHPQGQPPFWDLRGHNQHSASLLPWRVFFLKYAAGREDMSVGAGITRPLLQETAYDFSGG